MGLLAIITARGGSKGIPKKNMIELNGNPLIYYTIKAAKNSKYISDIVVTSDNNEILAYSQKLGVKTILRPKYLAEDKALSIDVLKHTLAEYSMKNALPKYIILLQPTSPLRSDNHIDLLVKQFRENEYNSCISVSSTNENPFSLFEISNDQLIPLSPDKLGIPRQKFNALYKSNGAMYLIKSVLLIKENSLYVEPIQPFIMSQEDSIDIDTVLDLKLSELVMIKKNSNE